MGGRFKTLGEIGVASGGVKYTVRTVEWTDTPSCRDALSNLKTSLSSSILPSGPGRGITPGFLFFCLFVCLFYFGFFWFFFHTNNDNFTIQ